MVFFVEIKRKYIKILKDNLEEKNVELKEWKFNLEIKRKYIVGFVKFLEENYNIMIDYSLLEKFIDLNSRMLNKDNNEEEIYLLKYEDYGDSKELLKLMMGYIFDLNNILFYFFRVELF